MLEESAEEEALVAELELLGINYLSRQSDRRAVQARPPAQLLADLVRQPGARVRHSVISVLLAHPEYARVIPDALRQLSEDERSSLRLLYTAAVLLQQKYADDLRQAAQGELKPLPDLFSDELGIPSNATLASQIDALGRVHRCATNVVANWTGTYDNVAQKLLRRWEMERRWSLSPRKHL